MNIIDGLDLEWFTLSTEGILIDNPLLALFSEEVPIIIAELTIELVTTERIKTIEDTLQVGLLLDHRLLFNHTKYNMHQSK